ncbi:MAG: hypothetical protein RR584_12695 [Comamonas sp.]
MTIPGKATPPQELTAADRAQRLQAAEAVTAEAPMAAVKKPKPATKGLRPWEVAAATGNAGANDKQRVPLIMDSALRAKLDYLASNSSPKESMSDIACIGMANECMRIEFEHELMVDKEAVKAQTSGRLERVLDNKHSSITGTSRMVAMVPAELNERMRVIRDMKLVKTVSELALAGIEDECNFRLKQAGLL